jgi:hypothetical protein
MADWWYLWSPWLKFMRMIFIPALRRSARAEGVLVPGPMVQMMPVLRKMGRGREEEEEVEGEEEVEEVEVELLGEEERDWTLESVLGVEMVVSTPICRGSIQARWASDECSALLGKSSSIRLYTRAWLAEVDMEGGRTVNEEGIGLVNPFVSCWPEVKEGSVVGSSCLRSTSDDTWWRGGEPNSSGPALLRRTAADTVAVNEWRALAIEEEEELLALPPLPPLPPLDADDDDMTRGRHNKRQRRTSNGKRQNNRRSTKRGMKNEQSRQPRMEEGEREADGQRERETGDGRWSVDGEGGERVQSQQWWAAVDVEGVKVRGMECWCWCRSPPLVTALSRSQSLVVLLFSPHSSLPSLSTATKRGLSPPLSPRSIDDDDTDWTDKQDLSLTSIQSPSHKLKHQGGSGWFPLIRMKSCLTKDF